MIEYDPEDVETFIAVADAIEAAFPSMIVEGNEEGDGRPGSFEVTTSDGFKVYSRLANKQSPNPDDLILLIVQRNANDGAAERSGQDGPMCG